MTDAQRIVEATLVAAIAHGKQKRANKMPYIQHPIAVAALVARQGASVDVICAALNHDVVENTHATLDELRAKLGVAVAATIAEVTDASDVVPSERKQAMLTRATSISSGAADIKRADMISNLADMLEAEPDSWSPLRIFGYWIHCSLLAAVLATRPDANQLDADLAQLIATGLAKQRDKGQFALPATSEETARVLDAWYALIDTRPGHIALAQALRIDKKQ